MPTASVSKREPVPARLTIHETTLTASAERVDGNKASKYRRLNQGWQLEAFTYYRSLGECYFPAQFYAHAFPSIRFYAAVKDAQGVITELDPQDWASQQFDRIQDPGGGRSQLLTAYGKLQFLIGDCYLVGTMGDSPDDEGWEILSPSELRGVPGSKDRYVRVNYPGAPVEELDGLPDDEFEPTGKGVVVYRIWQRDPEYTFLADSGVRSVLPLYKQLALLELAVTARAQSRISNAKVLLVADELSLAPADGHNEDNPEVDTLLKRLGETFVQPIKQPGSASAVAPPMIRVPADMIEKGSAMAVIEVANTGDTYQEIQARDEIRNRIALGLDMPAEIMLGKGDANHWSGWAIDDDAWKSHLKPPTIIFCDDIGRAFLRPLARQEGEMNPDGTYTGRALPTTDPEGNEQQGEEVTGTLVVWFDEAAVVNHPDRTEDFRQAYRDGVIGGAAYREAIGAEDGDAPSEAELDDMLKFVGKRGVVDEAGQAPDQAGQDVPVQGNTVAKQPPSETEAQQTQLQDEESSVQASAFGDQCVGAAALAVARCYALAGSRIRTKLKPASDTHNALLAAALGEENLGSLEPAALVRGGSDELQLHLTVAGIPEGAVKQIGRLVEAHAAATLCSPAPLSETACAYVRKAVGALRIAA